MDTIIFLYVDEYKPMPWLMKRRESRMLSLIIEIEHKLANSRSNIEVARLKADAEIAEFLQFLPNR